jgi:NTE family protein
MRALILTAAFVTAAAASIPVAGETGDPARSTLATGALAQQGVAQPAATAPSRPKVCVVLSGGGARGAAHIGVLHVLEELHVPVDCIVGTSMGALIGGAYASGMTTGEMTTMIERISTNALFIEKPPRQEQSSRRKADERSLLFGVEIGIRDGELRFQKGVVSGLQLEAMLRQISKVRGFHKFDELPIQYRAVATDLVTGNAVVFDQGELPLVMRASMSVPAAVAPAEIDGKLLVDGGLTNNLPIDVARKLGADIVVAVNLGTPLATREELGSIFGVTSQMINILTEQNVRASLAMLKPTDILIAPELGDFSAADFDHLPKTVPIGEAAARKATAQLAALGVSTDAYAALRARQREGALADIRPIAEIRFAPLARVNPRTLSALVETQPDRPLDQATLDADMRRLYGTGDFEHVNYRVLEEANRRVLEIDAIEKAWGPNYLRFGLGLGSDLEGDTFFNFAVSHRRTWLNSLGAEWRSDAQVGRTTRLATELYQPLGTEHGFFVVPRVELERRIVDVFDGSLRVARYSLRSGRLTLEAGTDVRRFGEVRVGLLTGSIKAGLDIGPEVLSPPSGRIRQGAVTLRADADHFDSANFPRSGFAGSGTVFSSQKALGADDAYAKWDADFSTAISFGPHSLAFGLKGAGRLGSDPLPRYDLVQWGGLLQQSGYPFGGLIGEELTFGRAVYTYKLLNQRLLEGLYAGVSLEAGRLERPLVPGSPSGFLRSAAVVFAADTPIGPLYLGYGLAADGNRSAYLYLGRP